MTRIVSIAAVMALVVLVATALLGPLQVGTGQLGPAKAEAAECTWQRHTKRIVKHVRRHGRLRKVVRKRHRWTCQPVVPAPAVPVPAPPAPPLPPAPEPEEEVANRLAVKSAEFYFVLSRPSVLAGEVTIELNNRGEDPHNLNLRREGDEGEPLQIPETASEERAVAKFDLPSGKYRLWCSLPEHEENGMYTALVVE